MSFKEVCIDNEVFRLHYKATTAVLLVCCLLVASKQFIGDPIECFMEGDTGKNEAMDTYCWAQSTFTLPSRAFDNKIGEQIPHLGVATPEEGDEHVYYNYYKWVCFSLFVQAMLFYVPHYLWKVWEGRKCQMLVMDKQSQVTPEETRLKQQQLITDFMASLHHQNIYAFRFFFCEVLNFVNVVAQIYFMDLFRGYGFPTYGSRVVQYTFMDPKHNPDPMALVFPKTTKCTFHGASGQCELSINDLNEKIYVVLWCWFIVLAVVTGLALLYRLAVLLSGWMWCQWPMMPYGLASQDDMAVVARKCQIGDWFVLCQMGTNMDPIAFKKLMGRLAEDMTR